MGKFWNWLTRKKDEPAEDVTGVVVAGPIDQPLADFLERFFADEDDSDSDGPPAAVPFLDDDFVDEEPDEYFQQSPRADGQARWAYEGRDYNHFRTVKVREHLNAGGFDFTVKGRGGKRRATVGTATGGNYAHKQDAKKAALRWINAQDPLIPTKFVDEQYGGDVVVDVDPDVARSFAVFTRAKQAELVGA